MSLHNLPIQKRHTLHEGIVTTLRRAILDGDFKAGEKLGQEELAQALGVSRMPIREALRQLEKEGFLKIETHVGAIVQPFTIDDIEEIYELRAMLEGTAIEKAMKYITVEEKMELKELNNAMEQALKGQKSEEFITLNTKFHQILRHASNGRRINTIIDMLWNGLPPYSPNILPKQMHHSIQEHHELLDALENNDVNRVKAITNKHILRTRDELIEYFREKRGD